MGVLLDLYNNCAVVKPRCNKILFHYLLQDIEFVQAKIDDLEKSMKRSNDKQLKIEHELCQRVGHVYSSVALHFFISSN
jgi:hypothetical protein